MRDLAHECIKAVAWRIPWVRNLYESRNALLAERDTLATRLQSGPKGSPFFHYHSILALEEIILRHALADVTPRPGYFVNFLGVAIDPKFVPGVLDRSEGQIEGPPIPANWHADIAEWGAALRAVELARDSFTVVELGCGWGCWLNNAGTAARRAGLAVHLIGVEGEESLLEFGRQACAINGFSKEQLELHQAIAASWSGIALCPKSDVAGAHWGLEPVFGATGAQRTAALASGKYRELPVIAIQDIVNSRDRVDLLHIDIQGGEADLIAGSTEIMNHKIAYVLVGTHSRQIEGRIMDTMLQEGWILEVERPAILTLNNGVPAVTVDGVQAWRNPRLT
jgi:FkbM family methyltransferase